MLVNNFGIDWITGGKLDAKIIHPARSGDTVYTGGTIESVTIHGNSKEVVCDAWVKNDEGKLLIVSKASFRKQEQ